jgi:hypothetical protein
MSAKIEYRKKIILENMKLQLYLLWWPNLEEHEQMEKLDMIRHIPSKHGDFFYLCENSRFSLNFFNWDYVNLKKVHIATPSQGSLG